MKIYKLIIWLSVIGLAIYGGYRINGNKIEYVSIEKEVILDNLIAKINELKGNLVKDIKTCESGGYKESDGLITFDPHKTNKSVAPASIGSYQWKVASVKYYYNLLYGKTITGKEAILIALDDEKAGELTSDVIFKTDNGLSNWINCSNKVGGKARLEVIKQLEK